MTDPMVLRDANISYFGNQLLPAPPPYRETPTPPPPFDGKQGPYLINMFLVQLEKYGVRTPLTQHKLDFQPFVDI
jgi:hypothetical protein